MRAAGGGRGEQRVAMFSSLLLLYCNLVAVQMASKAMARESGPPSAIGSKVKLGASLPGSLAARTLCFHSHSVHPETPPFTLLTRPWFLQLETDEKTCTSTTREPVAPDTTVPREKCNFSFARCREYLAL